MGATPIMDETTTVPKTQTDVESDYVWRSISIEVSEEALPEGLLPPPFPAEYVAGTVAPFLPFGCGACCMRAVHPTRKR